MLLEEINKHELDSRISFVDEGHIYFIDGKSNGIISCTSFIHKFFGQFNATQVIQQIQKSTKYKTDPTYKYYGKSTQEIKEEWNMTAVLGTKLHYMIELYYNDLEVEYEEDSGFEQFLLFQQDHESLQIYRTEWRIFDETLKISGSIDAIFKHKDNTISIYDWKRTPEIVTKSFNNKTARKPINNLLDCNYYHYSLQLNLYRHILETHYNQIVKDMFLIVLHPTNTTYQKVEVNRMEPEIQAILQERKEYLGSTGTTTGTATGTEVESLII